MDLNLQLISTYERARQSITDNFQIIQGAVNGLLQVTAREVPFSALPQRPPTGTTANISDSPTDVWGATVSIGGSSAHVAVRWNGSVWTVTGK